MFFSIPYAFGPDTMNHMFHLLFLSLNPKPQILNRLQFLFRSLLPLNLKPQAPTP